jgi:hypothetical protein
VDSAEMKRDLENQWCIVVKLLTREKLVIKNSDNE